MVQAKRKNIDDHALAGELADIKRLLILQLLGQGYQAKDIARTLGMSKSAISRMVPARSIKKRTP